MQNSKLQFKIKNFKSGAGFTLIELLVSMTIMIVVGGIVIGILVSSLRGTNKTNTLNSVTRNGSYAASQMAKMIQGAQSLSGLSLNGTDFNPSCVPIAVGALTPTPTPSQYKAVKITSFDGELTIFSCKPSSVNLPSTIASNGASLLDTSAVSLSANSCYFTCTQNTSLDYPVIGINFSLNAKQPTGMASSFGERTASATAIPFQTSVTVRNQAR